MSNELKDNIIENLKALNDLLEIRISYMKENHELEMEKRIMSYQKDAYPNLVKEIDYWRERAERLQLMLNYHEQKNTGEV